MQSDLGTDMNTEQRQPSRLPVRGTLGLVGTAGALALLLSFRGAPPIGEAVAAIVETLATDEWAIARASESRDTVAVAESMTLTGDPFETGWGDVQVVVTLEGTDITDVQTMLLPDGDRHSSRISDYVAPVLREEVITSDSADVSVISGATYTSKAYARSLQSALDQLGSETAAAAEMVAAAEVNEPAPEIAASEPITVAGDAVSIRWGTVQVAVTAQGGDILEVETLSIPDGDRKSAQISDRVEPALREEAIAYDTSDVSVISGATYTSRAYAASLQSALDQLGV
jgi:uncharacterized protein with FMN-binding domain